MNENINLIEILKNAPKGTKLYSSLIGDCELKFVSVSRDNITVKYKKIISTDNNSFDTTTFDKFGRYFTYYGECTLFPSKEQRDWSKFKIDLPIDTTVVVSDNKINWRLRYYAGNNLAYQGGYKSKDAKVEIYWKYIIPFDKFNPNNIEESLKYNIVK